MNTSRYYNEGINLKAFKYCVTQNIMHQKPSSALLLKYKYSLLVNDHFRGADV